jgi:hypothetical protein
MNILSTYAQIDVGGPCYILDNGIKFYFDGGVKITPVPVWRALPSSVAGEEDDNLVDLTYKITGTPKSVWKAPVNYTTEFLPASLTNFTYTGLPLLGTANNVVSIVSPAASGGFTFNRATLTKMPTVYYGLGKPLWGEAEWTGFWQNGFALNDPAAFYTLNNTVWNQADYPVTHQEQLAQLIWGAVADWSSVFAEEGFQHSHELKLNPIKQGNITVDMKLQGYRAMLKFQPQQPTTTQLMAALAYQNAGGGIGTRRSANANDAVITLDGVTPFITLKSMGLRVGEFEFDNKLNRHGEFSLVTALTAPGNRLVIA